MVSSGANVIIWCYHVMLSSGMITPPFFCLSWKLHSLPSLIKFRRALLFLSFLPALFFKSDHPTSHLEVPLFLSYACHRFIFCCAHFRAPFIHSFHPKVFADHFFPMGSSLYTVKQTQPQIAFKMEGRGESRDR